MPNVHICFYGFKNRGCRDKMYQNRVQTQLKIYVLNNARRSVREGLPTSGDQESEE